MEDRTIPVIFRPASFVKQHKTVTAQQQDIKVKINAGMIKWEAKRYKKPFKIDNGARTAENTWPVLLRGGLHTNIAIVLMSCKPAIMEKRSNGLYKIKR